MEDQTLTTPKPSAGLAVQRSPEDFFYPQAADGVREEEEERGEHWAEELQQQNSKKPKRSRQAKRQGSVRNGDGTGKWPLEQDQSNKIRRRGDKQHINHWRSRTHKLFVCVSVNRTACRG